MNRQFSKVVSLPRSKFHVSPEWLPEINSEGSASVNAFERFMSWLDPDHETAALKYESIRGRLIMMFKARRCVFAEDLADATIERVAQKLADLTTCITGDPARYFYGVAKKIYLEHQHEITTACWKSDFPTPLNTDKEELEKMLTQLDKALSTIPRSDRELILKYYSTTGKNKIDHRRILAEQFGIGLNAMRIRVFRIRKEIKNYMLRCEDSHNQ